MADNVPDNKPEQPSRKRKLIVENALRIMRRKREAMDKSVLKLIKDMVSSNPAMSKALGYEVEEKAEEKLVKTVKPVNKPKQSEETVDQGHNMEVLAKLMTLDPKGKDKVKAVIKKSAKD